MLKIISGMYEGMKSCVRSKNALSDRPNRCFTGGKYSPPYYFLFM